MNMVKVMISNLDTMAVGLITSIPFFITDYKFI